MNRKKRNRIYRAEERRMCAEEGVKQRPSPPGFSMIQGTFIELNGNRELSVDGCRGILDYDMNLIKINCGKMVLKITGRNMTIRCMSQESVLVDGFILSVEFIT